MMTWRRGGGQPKYDMMTRGRGGSGYPPKMMTSFMNSPLHKKWSICQRNSRVGAPDWIVPKGSDFLIFHEGVQYLSKVFIYSNLRPTELIKNFSQTNLFILKDIHQPFCLTCNRENRRSFESNLPSCFSSCHTMFSCASQMLHPC